MRARSNILRCEHLNRVIDHAEREILIFSHSHPWIRGSAKDGDIAATDDVPSRASRNVTEQGQPFISGRRGIPLD